MLTLDNEQKYNRQHNNRTSTPYKPTQLPKIKKTSNVFRYDYDLIKNRLALDTNDLIWCEEINEEEKTKKQKTRPKSALKRSFSSIINEAKADAFKSKNNAILFKTDKEEQSTT